MKSDVAMLPMLDLEEPSVLKSYHTKRLNRRHHVAIHMHAAGFTNKEIAERLGYTDSRVSIILSHPQAKQVLRVLAERVADQFDDVHVRLRLIAPEALTKAHTIMKTTADEKLAKETAFGLLDRAGYGKINKQITLTSPLTDEQAERLSKDLRASEPLEIQPYYAVLDDEETNGDDT